MTQQGHEKGEEQKTFSSRQRKKDMYFQPHYKAVKDLTDETIQQAILRGDLDEGPQTLEDIIDMCREFLVNAGLYDDDGVKMGEVDYDGNWWLDWGIYGHDGA